MYYWILADVSHWGIASSSDKRGDETENLSSQADINPTCAMLAAPCCSQQELLGEGGDGGDHHAEAQQGSKVHIHKVQ